MNVIIAILLGGFFGFALYFVGATSRSNILKMLRLQDLTLAKVILFAIGFASVILSVTGILGIFDASHLSIKAMNLGVIVGGLIFGIGFGGIGTCPGTCVGALGGHEGVKRAVAAVVGGLFGAFAFSMSYGYFKSVGIFEKLNLGKMTLFNISERYPSVFSFGYTGLLIAGILFMAGAYLLPKKILD